MSPSAPAAPARPARDRETHAPPAPRPTDDRGLAGPPRATPAAPAPRRASASRWSAAAPLLALLAVLGVELALLHPGAVLRGEVLTAAALAHAAEPWRAEPVPDGRLNPLLSDDLDMFAPWDASLRGRQAGGAPLWDPHASAGAPLIANDQSAVFAPAQLLRWLWRSPRARSTGLLLVAPIAAIGMFLLGSALGLGRWPAAVAALAWANAACLQVWLLYPLAETAAWFSWLAAGVAGLLAGHPGRTAWRLCAAGGLAAVLLAGHLPTAGQLLVVGSLLAGSWLLVDAGARRRAGRLVVPLLAGALLALPQVLTTLEYYGVSRARLVRGGALGQPAAAETLSPGAAWSWLVPTGFGTPQDGTYAGPLNFNEATASIGALGLVLLVVALFAGRRRPVAALALATAGCLAAAYGVLPLAAAAARVPVLAWAPGVRWIVVAQWTACVLAGFGAEAILRARPRAALRFGGGAGALLLVAASLHPSARSAASAAPEAALAVATACAMLAAAALLAALAPRWRRPLAGSLMLGAIAASGVLAFGGFNPSLAPASIPGRTDATERIRDALGDGRILSVGWVFPRNTHLLAGLSSVQGWDAINLERMTRYSETAGFEPRHKPAGRVSVNSAMLRRAVVRVVASDRPIRARGMTAMGIRATSAFRAFRVEAAHPLAGWYPRAIEARDLDHALELLASPRALDAGAVVIEGPEAAAPRPGDGSAHVALDYSRARPEAVTIETDRPAPGWVVFREAFAPGWRARLDGRAAPLRPADAAFMAVRVPAGRHVVELSYRPDSWRLGLLAALLGGALLAGQAIAPAAARRLRHAASAPRSS